MSEEYKTIPEFPDCKINIKGEAITTNPNITLRVQKEYKGNNYNTRLVIQERGKKEKYRSLRKIVRNLFNEDLPFYTMRVNKVRIVKKEDFVEMHITNPKLGKVVAILDNEDYARVSKYSWSPKTSGGDNNEDITIFRNVSVKLDNITKQVSQTLQNFIIGIPPTLPRGVGILNRKKKRVIDFRRENLDIPSTVILEKLRGLSPLNKQKIYFLSLSLLEE